MEEPPREPLRGELACMLEATDGIGLARMWSRLFSSSCCECVWLLMVSSIVDACACISRTRFESSSTLYFLASASLASSVCRSSSLDRSFKINEFICRMAASAASTWRVYFCFRVVPRKFYYPVNE